MLSNSLFASLACLILPFSFLAMLALFISHSLSSSFFKKGSREQLAIAEFASALLIIPKTLSVNAAKDATELVAKLRAFHNTAQQQPEKAALKW